MATRSLAVGNGLTSAESEVLSQAFSYLANSMDTTALLQPSMGRKLITARQRSECVNEPDPYKKAEVFLGHLQRAVNGDVTNFTRLYKCSTKPIKTDFAVTHDIKNTLKMDA